MTKPDQDTRPSGRLMPNDAYPDTMPEAKRDFVDGRIRENLHLIPTVPGQYRDRAGSLWTLTPEGVWADCNGVTRTADYTPLLVLFAPLTPEPSSDAAAA